MRAALIALALVCTASPAFAQKAAEPVVEDSVIGYADTDARMNGAIEQARSLLPLFLAEFRGSSAPGAFTIKAGLPTDDGGVEHIWVGDLQFEGDHLVGALINEPYYMRNLHEGSRVNVAMDQISDWTIATPDGVYGGYTTRIMLDDMAPAQAALYRRQLSMTANPTPAWWVQ